MEQLQIFPEIKIVSPRIICECIGATVRRVMDLGTVTELCTSNHIQGESAVVAEANRVIN